MFDFYYQSGEFSDGGGFSWGDFLSALIGSGTALCVYYLESKREKSKASREKNQLEIDKLKYLEYILIQSFIYVNHLTKAIDTEIDKFKSLGGNHSILIQDMPESFLDRLSNKIDHEQYYHAYINQIGSSSEIIIGFFGSCDYMYFVRQLIYKQINEMESFNHEIAVPYGKQIKDFELKIRTISNNLKSSLFGSPGYKLYIVIENFYAERKTKQQNQAKILTQSDIANLVNELYIPVIEEFYTYNETYENKYKTELEDLIEHRNLGFLIIKRNESFIKHISELSNHLKKCINDLDPYFKDFSKQLKDKSLKK